MATYYFDLHECGSVTPDRDGLEVPDLAAARDMALTAARDIMCGEIKSGALCLSCHIEIREEGGRMVDRITFREAVSITGL